LNSEEEILGIEKTVTYLFSEKPQKAISGDEKDDDTAAV